MNILKLLAVLLISLVLSACASSRSGDVYSRDQTMREMVVRSGIVESVREVSMEGTQSGAGTLAGAAVGGVAGSTVGGGRGQIVGAIIGAVLGGIAGNSIEENATKKNALEISVSLDGGKLIAVVQEMGEVFHPGERVRVLSGNGSTRVTH
ncbi:MAG: glycine zipper 2TM domain-containing protein [Propionivibrio sp.]|uniref:glycine zipper 2TM domain-containing protein n=1 Tax=Propionivibrio sp. TaxID=2212460 RepID=UPI0025FCD3E7|nr:glycine zipper 2TM domain-containing protein [Propionivibrio sp.]MBK7355072.1 glycine zipper 2TM domain-containing protein [Propionivibrio sp.]MBK8402442.1 glycine zipper 2TM domain-containing protein [Propionivibrio sp.]MBK8892900.1 glycine zipper 2TM domain-containing protein [Propionivibrio sp.]MBL0206437.1 glycine zipper 2TM domain-containing protein [Propionivibrio sp.]